MYKVVRRAANRSLSFPLNRRPNVDNVTGGPSSFQKRTVVSKNTIIALFARWCPPPSSRKIPTAQHYWARIDTPCTAIATPTEQEDAGRALCCHTRTTITSSMTRPCVKVTVTRLSSLSGLSSRRLRPAHAFRMREVHNGPATSRRADAQHQK